MKIEIYKTFANKKGFIWREEVASITHHPMSAKNEASVERNPGRIAGGYQ
jgi:hypothetical protein